MGLKLTSAIRFYFNFTGIWLNSFQGSELRPAGLKICVWVIWPRSVTPMAIDDTSRASFLYDSKIFIDQFNKTPLPPVFMFTLRLFND